MTKTKILSIVLIVVTLCGLCLVFAGCPEKEQERYDILIKVICKEVINDRVTGPILDEWIFPVGTDELYTEREYDGKQYTYTLYRFNYPNHPRWSKYWFSPSSGCPTMFDRSFDKKRVVTEEPAPKYVCEKGEYSLILDAYGKRDEFKNRTVRLFITVK